MPYRTVENKYRCVFWYSLLKLFTHTSIPVWNPLSLEFIGAMPCGSGCLKRLNTLTSRRIIPESRQAKNGALDPLVLVNRLEMEATVGTDLLGMLEIGFLHPKAPQ